MSENTRYAAVHNGHRSYDAFNAGSHREDGLYVTDNASQREERRDLEKHAVQRGELEADALRDKKSPRRRYENRHAGYEC